MKQGDDRNTPQGIVDFAEDIFGQIDCDPCSNPSALFAPKVRYDRDTDGLVSPWKGRCLVNPPYSNIMPWVERAHTELASGNATDVLFVLPGDSSTVWWHHLFADACAHRTRQRQLFLVVPNKRFHFPTPRDPKGTPVGSTHLFLMGGPLATVWTPTVLLEAQKRGWRVLFPRYR